MSKEHDLLMVKVINWLQGKYPKATYRVEYPAGEGFADIVVSWKQQEDNHPRRMILEVKTNPDEGVSEAIRQLKRYYFSIRKGKGVLKDLDEREIIGGDPYLMVDYEKTFLYLVTNFSIEEQQSLLDLEGIGWLNFNNEVNPLITTAKERRGRPHLRKDFQIINDDDYKREGDE